MGKVQNLADLYRESVDLRLMIDKGCSLKEIASYMGVPSGTAGHVLELLNLRKSKPRTRLCKVAPVEWDEFTSYLLGYMLGDGCLHPLRNKTDRGQGAQWDISSADETHLSLLAGLLGDFSINKSVKKVKLGEAFCFRVFISDKRWYEFFISCGLLPSKSLLDIILLKEPPTDMYRHFVRGLLDSDGTVSYYLHDGYWCCTACLLGRKSYLLPITSKLKLDWTVTKNRKLDVISVASLDSLKRLYSYLYKDSSIFMLRKKAKFEEYFNLKGQ